MSARELPRGWSMATLRDVAVVSGGITKNSGRGPLPRQLPYLRVANVYANELRLDDIAEIDVSEADVQRALLNPGDLLVVEGNGSLDQIGRVALWTGEINPCLHQNHLIKVRLPKLLFGRFILYWLLSPEGRAKIARIASSTSGLHTLSISKVEGLPVFLAPLAEQSRIIVALDSYLPLLDEAVATLERVQRNLKRYRASVLKAAVEGRLVPTEAELARAENRHYEPASKLLERILVERRRRWEEAELARLKAAGKPPKDERWKAKYQEPDPPDTTGLPALPEGWCWATAAALYWDAGYGTSQKCDYSGKGVPVLRIPNIQHQRVTLDDVKFALSNRDLSPNGAVQVGDFLFIRTNGSKALIGRGAVVRETFDAAHHFASYLIRLRLVRVDVLPEWFAFAWHAPFVRTQLLVDAASSAGQHNVSLGAAQSYAIPLAPSAEQRRILAEVDRVDSFAATVDQYTAAAALRSQRLRQSVLKWAFEGKLVDQDPTDAPAAVLLARIRAERETEAAAPAVRVVRKRRGKKSVKKQRRA